MPRMTRQARHRTVIAQKEHQIGKLRDEVERLRKILLERDTGTGENRETVLPKNRNTEGITPEFLRKSGSARCREDNFSRLIA